LSDLEGHLLHLRGRGQTSRGRGQGQISGDALTSLATAKVNPGLSGNFRQFVLKFRLSKANESPVPLTEVSMAISPKVKGCGFDPNTPRLNLSTFSPAGRGQKDPVVLLFAPKFWQVLYTVG